MQPLGGTIEHVEAFGPDGQRVPLAVQGGRLTPLKQLTPGEQVSVEVQVRRPGWLGWALGHERTERLTLHAPVAQVSEQWMTVPPGSTVHVSFDQPVSAVAYGSSGRLTHRATLHKPRSSISLGSQPATGSTEIAAAARSWETVGKPMQVSWFPQSHTTVMATIPASGAPISPYTPIRLTFSKTVSEALGSSQPTLSPSTPGHWHETDSHTLVFTPSGFGAPLGSQLRIQLPREVAVTASSGSALRTTSQSNGPCLPARRCVCSNCSLNRATCPSTGSPPARQWHARPAPRHRLRSNPRAEALTGAIPTRRTNCRRCGPRAKRTTITRGAIMKFESTHEITVDGLAGPAVWRALLSDAIAGKRLSSGYTYVYVHREVPEVLTLWHDGHTVLTSAANTGIAGAETELGTFPVFEHIPEGTMSGTNPDGSHYEDPGIKWISYFNGGDAIHNFDRASFGTPQSLGCVELPLQSAAEVWPYTPIGTLVTIET